MLVHRSHRWSGAQWAGIVLFAIMAIWLYSPIATSTHVEAFSARLESEAILVSQGKLALDDQAYPVNTGYIYTSRLGVVHALAAIMRVTGPGDISFRLLIWLSYALFVGSCVFFARRWGEVPTWAALAFLVLTPGLVEVSFFFADNVPSAALACLALALIAPKSSWARWVLIGALFALATLMRLDALLMAPSILVVSWLAEEDRVQRLAVGWLCATGSAAAVFLMSWKVWHVSLLQSIAFGRWFGSFHIERSSPWLTAIMVALGFFALPSALLLAAGVRHHAASRSRLWNLCLTVYPTLLYLVLMTKAIELRDFLLLGAPFLVLQGGDGLRSLPGLYRVSEPYRRLLLQVALTVCLLTLVAPPIVFVKDGPRTFSGRLWSTPMWWQWQRDTQDSLAACDRLIAQAGAGKPLLAISTHFNPDGYLHLRLIQQGFAVDPRSFGDLPGTLTERYVRGGRSVLHVRTQNPYAVPSSPPYSLPYDYVQHFQLKAALSQTKPTDYDQAFLLTWGKAINFQRFIASTAQFQRSAGPQEIILPADRDIPAWRQATYGSLRVIPLSPQDVQELEIFAAQQVEAAEAHRDPLWQPLRTVDDLRRMVRSPYWEP